MLQRRAYRAGVRPHEFWGLTLSELQDLFDAAHESTLAAAWAAEAVTRRYGGKALPGVERLIEDFTGRAALRKPPNAEAQGLAARIWRGAMELLRNG